MSRWLYQMSEDWWPSEKYRRTVSERRTVRWPTHKRMFAHEAPAPGDIVICFYAPRNCKKPGVCGFGVVTKYFPKTRRFAWLVLPPTNSLKHRPWWDERIKEIVELVRAQSVRGTMYAVPAALDTDIRRGLFAWAGR